MATETEADILEEILSSAARNLSPEQATSFLKLRFSRPTTTRIRTLLRKNNAGKIRPQERVTLDNYLRVGQFLDLLHAKLKSRLARDNKGH